jgi:hypothetical protein
MPRALSAALAFCAALGVSVPAEGIERSTTLSLTGAYYFGYRDGYDAGGWFAPPRTDVVEGLPHDPDDPGRDVGNGWGEAGLAASVAHSIRWPFLTGEGPLLEGNNIELVLSGDLTPLTVAASAEATLTPAAVVEIAAGASAGTGWSLGSSNGLGRNLGGVEHDSVREEPFSGLVLSGWVSATLQFDFEALWPGDWHHIVIAAGPRLEYWTFTKADDDTAWQWQADRGENFNGWRFAASAFLGYRMPLKVDTAGVRVSTLQALGSQRDRSPMDEGGWGSDFVQVSITPLASAALSERLRLTALLQMQTAPDYTEATIGNRYFELRDYDGWHLYLRRLVAVLAWRL